MLLSVFMFPNKRPISWHEASTDRSVDLEFKDKAAIGQMVGVKIGNVNGVSVYVNRSTPVKVYRWCRRLASPDRFFVFRVVADLKIAFVDSGTDETKCIIRTFMYGGSLLSRPVTLPADTWTVIPHNVCPPKQRLLEWTKLPDGTQNYTADRHVVQKLHTELGIDWIAASSKPANKDGPKRRQPKRAAAAPSKRLPIVKRPVFKVYQTDSWFYMGIG